MNLALSDLPTDHINRINFDLALLRTLAAVVDLGSVARAAEAIGRSQPAVSLQIKRLEELLRVRLFQKRGRNLALTEAGDSMARYARKLLELNDEAVAAISTTNLSGSIRLGIPQDLADSWLTSVLARFARAHPSVFIEVRADRNSVLEELLSKEKLDLALMFGKGRPTQSVKLGRVPIVWIGPKSFTYDPSKPISLIAFDPPCLFRSAGVSALEKQKLKWRLSFSSPSLSSQWAAAEAGLGLAIRTPLGLPDSLTALGPGVGLPKLEAIDLIMRRGNTRDSKPVSKLQEILVQTVSEKLQTRFESLQ